MRVIQIGRCGFGPAHPTSGSLCLLAPRIVEMNNNSPPLTFKRFQTIVSRLELPRRPLPSVTQQQMNKCGAAVGDNHDQLYGIPSLEELGMLAREDQAQHVLASQKGGSPPEFQHGFFTLT